MHGDETMWVLDVGMKKEERNQRLQPAVGSWARSWIISAVAECRFLPPVLTSGLGSSAHIHLFNLERLHLMSYIVYCVKEQWVIPCSMTIRLCPIIKPYSCAFCLILELCTWQNMIMVYKKVFPVDFPDQLLCVQWSRLPSNPQPSSWTLIQPMRLLDPAKADHK